MSGIYPSLPFELCPPNDSVRPKLVIRASKGSAEKRTFASWWHQHFRALFEYIDIQKIRTPKGLDWLKVQYPSLTQNELMLEMQWEEAQR